MKLRVSNLSSSTTKSDLEELFEEFGRVESVKIFKSPNQAQSLAFVEMRREEEAKQAADSLHQQTVDGEVIEVRVSSDRINPQRPKAPVSPSIVLMEDEDELESVEEMKLIKVNPIMDEVNDWED